MRSSHPREPSQRQLRVGEQLRHIISEILHGHYFGDGEIDPAMITITEVRVTPDLKQARVYIITHDEATLENTLKTLNNDAYTFQKAVNRQSNLKFTPKIKFVFDHTFENAQKIEGILRDISYGKHDEE